MTTSQPNDRLAFMMFANSPSDLILMLAIRYPVGMKILVFGACGYVGSVLTNNLLATGHSVTVFDSLLFGNHLPLNTRLRILQRDVREPAAVAIAAKGHDAVIHLACISNDPSAELDPALTRAVNLD